MGMARYDSYRKVERNKALAEYRKNHQDLSLKEIGKVFSISRQRAWKILEREAKRGQPAT